MGVLGMPLPCTAVCEVEDGDEQGLRRVGECLSKRVGVVVCSDRKGGNGTESDGSSSGSSSSSSAGQTSTSSRAASGTASLSASSSAGATPSASTGGTSKGFGGQKGEVSKAGLMVFGVLALGSAVGMLM